MRVKHKRPAGGCAEGRCCLLVSYARRVKSLVRFDQVNRTRIHAAQGYGPAQTVTARSAGIKTYRHASGAVAADAVSSCNVGYKLVIESRGDIALAVYRKNSSSGIWRIGVRGTADEPARQLVSPLRSSRQAGIVEVTRGPGTGHRGGYGIRTAACRQKSQSDQGQRKAYSAAGSSPNKTEKSGSDFLKRHNCLRGEKSPCNLRRS